MKAEIQYHRLQEKVARMKREHEERIKSIRKENSELHKEVKALTTKLNNAHRALEKEHESNKEWHAEKTAMMRKIDTQKREIKTLEAHLANALKACKVSPDQIWMIDEYPLLRERFRDYVERHK